MPVGGRPTRRPEVMALASSFFSVLGGRLELVRMSLAGPARLLLDRYHVLPAAVTIAAHDPAGARHTTHDRITLRLIPGKARRST